MLIAGAASALPKHRYDQTILLNALKDFWGARLDNPEFMQRLHQRVGVDARHLALPMEQYHGITTWGQANDHWIDVALDLSEEALGLALQRAGLSQDALGAIFFVSVTGIASPSIDARLINRMTLPRHLKRVPDLRTGLRGGRRGRGARRGLRPRVSGPGGRGDRRGAVLAHAAARRPVDREPDLVGALWRRRGRRPRRGRAGAVPGSSHPRHALGLLPGHRTGDGLGHLGEGFPHRAVAGGAARRRAVLRRRRRCVSRQPRG